MNLPDVGVRSLHRRNGVRQALADSAERYFLVAPSMAVFPSFFKVSAGSFFGRVSLLFGRSLFSGLFSLNLRRSFRVDKSQADHVHAYIVDTLAKLLLVSAIMTFRIW